MKNNRKLFTLSLVSALFLRLEVADEDAFRGSPILKMQHKKKKKKNLVDQKKTKSKTDVEKNNNITR
jgi:hypothetical protein